MISVYFLLDFLLVTDVEKINMKDFPMFFLVFSE